MAFSGDGRSNRSSTMFKTLRRIRGHNLDSGLNDLTEAFASFMTRAKYFSVGHLRRTWSHSAVEFMKYRRRLPAILADDAGDGFGGLTDDLDSSGVSQNGKKNSLAPSFTLPPGGHSDVGPSCRRLHVANVPPKATLAQLTSFFSKFGRVASCTFPADKPTATLPRRNRGAAYLTFQTAEDAERALNAGVVELILYNQTMTVAPLPKTPQPKRSTEIPLVRNPSDGSLTSDGDWNNAQPSSPSFASSLGCLSDLNNIFNVLPDAVLSFILSYLNVSDRIRLERVCKRWQESSFQSWSHTKCLVLRHHFSIKQRNQILHNNTLKAILHRAGPHLLSLNLNGAAQFLNDYSLTIIAETCKRLIAVNLSGLKVQWTSLKVFAECSGPRLTSIVYREAYFLGDNAFWWLIRSCPNLFSIDFCKCRQLTGKCFRSLSTNLQSLRLDDCQKIEPAALQEVCLKCPSLRCLTVDDCILLDDPTLSAICRSLPDLEYLSLRFHPTFGGPEDGSAKRKLNFTSFGLSQLGRLSSLKSLRLDGNPMVDDSVLEALFKVADSPCVLHTLGLNDVRSGSISKSGLTAPMSNKCLPLVELDLNYLESVVVDQFLIAVARMIGSNLQVLRVRACTQITDAAVRILAQNCTKLRKLDLSDCFSVTNSSVKEFFYTARTVGSTGSQPGRLTLTLSGTSCDARQLTRALLSSQNADRVEFNFDHLGTERRGQIPGVEDDDRTDVVGDELDDQFESLMVQRSRAKDRRTKDRRTKRSPYPLVAEQ